MFGMEFVTATQQEKEFLMLFFHLAFDVKKDKQMDKSNGYNAYHCLGDLKYGDFGVDSRIDEIVQNTKTCLYTDKSNDRGEMEKKETKVFNNVGVLMHSDSDNGKNTLEEMLEIFRKRTKNINVENIPIIECHFMTAETEQNAISGSAAHSNYKNVDEELIKDMFNSGKLFRGINTPWKFIITSDGRIQLQDIYQTMIETWSFLKNDIVKRRKNGLEEKDKINNECCDKLLSTQFPFLNSLVENNDEIKKKNKEELWGALKQCMLLYALESNVDPDIIGNLQPQYMYELFKSYGLITGNSR